MDKNDEIEIRANNPSFLALDVFSMSLLSANVVAIVFWTVNF